MNSRIYSFLGLIQKAGKLSSGDDTVEIDIKKHKSKLLILAEDASENTKKRFQNSASHYNIPLLHFGTKEAIGYAIGKSERSILSINDEGFAETFKNKTAENGGVDIVKN